MQLTTQQLDLIKKIVNARLTKTELKEVTEKAKQILQRRRSKI